MSTAGITMVRDEADIIATTIRHMATQVDYLLVHDNMSTDGTREILDGLADELNAGLLVGRPLRMVVFSEEDMAYYQSKKMTRYAHLAHEIWGSEWIVPFDADEIWYSPFDGELKNRLNALGPQWLIVQADLYDHVCTALDDMSVADPVQRIQWRTVEKLELPKVAARWRQDLVIDMGNHRAFYDESGGTVSHDRFVVRHFPYRSPEQFLSKVRNGAAAYKRTDETMDEFGGHWRGYGQILEHSGPDVVLDNVFYRFFYDQNPSASAKQGRRPILHDPAPFRR